MSEELKPLIVDDSVLCGKCSNLTLPEAERFFCSPRICDRARSRREAAEAQRDADVEFYEGIIDGLITQTRKLLKAAENARRDTVYAVEAFLEEERIGLYYTYMKGDECLVGDRVSVNIIRRVLEDYAQS